jgi:hypothetical protein
MKKRKYLKPTVRTSVQEKIWSGGVSNGRASPFPTTNECFTAFFTTHDVSSRLKINSGGILYLSITSQSLKNESWK